MQYAGVGIRFAALITGTVVATLLVFFAMSLAPTGEKSLPIPDSAQVQEAEAWYYHRELCDGSFRVGDFMQHWVDRNTVHRTTKVSRKYHHNGYVYINVRRKEIHFNPYREENKGSYPVRCWRV